MSEIKIDGAVEVLQGDLAPGDKVYAVRKVPEKVLTVRDGDGDLSTDHDYYDPRDYSFFLASRVDVELPEAVGSVIRVNGVGRGGPVTWMLTDVRRWASQNEDVLDEDALRRMISLNKLSVEVL